MMRKYRHAGDESLQQKETMMGVCWMLVILLCCVSSHATQCPKSNIRYEHLKIYCTPEKSLISVFVPCPNVTAGDKTYKLYNDQRMIHNCKLTNGTTERCEAENGTKLNVQFQHENNSPGFRVNATSEAIFTCEGELYYPPPFRQIPNEEVVLIYTEGHRCQCEKSSCKENEPVRQTFPWIWITVVALLSSYSLAVTIGAGIIWFKLRSADGQNDYINTKPVPFRPRKNKNKVQNPIPRYL